MEDLKNRLDFERELSLIRGSLYYFEIIEQNESVKNDLYQEFINTQKQPSINLFLESRGFSNDYMEKELIQGFASMPIIDGFISFSHFENEFSDLRVEFFRLDSKGELAEKYYCHNLRQTSMIKTLCEVEAEVGKFKKYVVDGKDVDRYDHEAKKFAQSIESKLNELDNSLLKNEILKALLKDRDNIQIIAADLASNSATKRRKDLPLFGEKREKVLTELYDQLKRNLNFYLEKPIELLKTNNDYVPSLIETKENVSAEFKEKLKNNGFFGLEKVKSLSQQQQEKLCLLLDVKGKVKTQAYRTAMYDFLGFLTLMERQVTDIKVRDKFLEKLLGFGDRALRRCINGLNPKTKENIRYHSFKFKEEVKSDYELL